MTAIVVYVKLVSKELNHFRAIAAFLLTLSVTFQNRQSTIRNANKLLLFCLFRVHVQLIQFGGTFTKPFSKLSQLKIE